MPATKPKDLAVPKTCREEALIPGTSAQVRQPGRPSRSRVIAGHLQRRSLLRQVQRLNIALSFSSILSRIATTSAPDAVVGGVAVFERGAPAPLSGRGVVLKESAKTRPETLADFRKH